MHILQGSFRFTWACSILPSTPTDLQNQQLLPPYSWLDYKPPWMRSYLSPCPLCGPVYFLSQQLMDYRPPWMRSYNLYRPLALCITAIWVGDSESKTGDTWCHTALICWRCRSFRYVRKTWNLFLFANTPRPEMGVIYRANQDRTDSTPEESRGWKSVWKTSRI